jgi:hypothetical protein
MQTGHCFYIERHALFGWIYYAGDAVGERYPATSMQRAVDAGVEYAETQTE